jgi:hypothetical protein
MTVEQVKQFITDQGWTPQERKRGRGKLYLYAARKAKKSRKVEWRYIAPLSKVENLTEQDVLDRLALTTK